MLIALMFVAVFATVTLLLLAATRKGTQEVQQTRSRLRAIGLGPQSPEAEAETITVRRAEILSTLPWLDRLLHRLNIGPALRLLLYQADSQWTVGRLVLISVLIAVISGYLIYMRTEAVLLAAAIAVFGGAAPFLYVFQKRERRFNRMRQLLPEALDLMVAAIRAGHSLSSAMGMVAKESPEPVRREFRQSYDEQNFGLDLRTAMANLTYRVPIHDIRIIAASVLIQKETGGNLTEILEKVGHLIREDFRLQRQVMVHTAQGRLTGWILSILPAILGVGLYTVNPEHMRILWTRDIGLKMLYGAIAMTVTGVLIIRRIVRIQV